MDKAWNKSSVVNHDNNELVMDFVVQGDNVTTHVLNAVSPAFGHAAFHFQST